MMHIPVTGSGWFGGWHWTEPSARADARLTPSEAIEAAQDGGRDPPQHGLAFRGSLITNHPSEVFWTT